MHTISCKQFGDSGTENLSFIRKNQARGGEAICCNWLGVNGGRSMQKETA